MPSISEVGMKQGAAHTWLKRAGVFLAVVAVLVAGTVWLSYVFYPKNNSPEAGMIEAGANGFLGEPKNSIDVLVVGDSRSFASFAPPQMWHEQGFTSYDAGVPGQLLSYSNTLLTRAFTVQSPQLVVFETDSFYKEFPITDAMFQLLADKVPLFEYHSRWKHLTWDDVTQPIVTTWTDPLKGYRIQSGALAADDEEEEGDNTLEAVPRNARIYLSALLAMCREHGATPIFVSAPNTVNDGSGRHEALQALANEYGVDFIDLNEVVDQIGINWQTDSKDGGDHLNYKGTIKVSTYLGKYLAETYDLPDHRGEEAYASWDDSYDYYLETMPKE